MRRHEFLGSVAALCGGARLRPVFAQEPSRAWVGASLWLGDGHVLEDATLVVTGERISLTFRRLLRPPGAS